MDSSTLIFLTLRDPHPPMYCVIAPATCPQFPGSLVFGCPVLFTETQLEEIIHMYRTFDHAFRRYGCRYVRMTNGVHRHALPIHLARSISTLCVVYKKKINCVCKEASALAARHALLGRKRPRLLRPQCARSKRGPSRSVLRVGEGGVTRLAFGGSSCSGASALASFARSIFLPSQ